MLNYDYVVVIGRFQIPTYAHFELFKQALDHGKHLIIALGSSNLARSLKNPFNATERAMMIQNCDIPEISEAFTEKRISFIELEDSPYSDQWWVEQVQRKVGNIANANTALLGCNKDESSYYIKMFPQWDLIEVDKIGDYNATECRESYFRYGPFDKSLGNKLSRLTSMGVIKTLQMLPSYVHESLQKRQASRDKYREQWGMGPFQTVDAVVIKNGHILVIRRRDEDFNSELWALPGGFVDGTDITLLRAVYRELAEETGLKADWYEDRNWYPIATSYFDKPDRDERAEIRTSAFCFHLLDTGPLPHVEGLDDALEAHWVPIADLRADNMWNDHYFIMRKLTAGYNVTINIHGNTN